MLHAVVIGVDKYTDSRIPDLQSARSDAEAISARIRDGIVADERSVHTLVDNEATKDAIIDAIGEALPRRQTDNDLVVIYFAGHGSPEQKDPPDRVSRYLIPHDANYERVFSSGIGLETDLVSILERLFTARVLVILDACFSGKAGGRTFIGSRLERRISQFRAPLSLRELELGYGKAILAACGDDELALEQSDHGVFTRNLIDVLSNIEEPTIGIGELYESIFARVVRDTDASQHPVFKGIGIQGMRFPRLSEVREGDQGGSDGQ